MPIIYARQLFLLHFDEYIRLIKQSGKPYRSELSTFVLSYVLLLLLIFLQEAIGLLVAQLLESTFLCTWGGVVIIVVGACSLRRK